MADILNIPGKIHSTAADGRAVETNEVYDNNKETFQSSINADFESRIVALHEQDYLYYDATSDDTSIATILPPEGDTGKIYRIANWNANATGVNPDTYYNTAYYSEYAWDASASTPAYTLLSVSASGITDIPAENDSRLITSRGVKSAIDNAAFSTNEKLNQVGIDAEPTAGSDNLVKSGGVAEKVGQLGQHLAEDLTPSFIPTSYFNLGSASIGSTINLNQALSIGPYACLKTKVEAGDIVFLKTYANSGNAKAYAITNNAGVVKTLQSDAITENIIITESGWIVVNTGDITKSYVKITRKDTFDNISGVVAMEGNAILNPSDIRKGNFTSTTDGYSVTTKMILTNGSTLAVIRTNRPNKDNCHYTFGYGCSDSVLDAGSKDIQENLEGQTIYYNPTETSSNIGIINSPYKCINFTIREYSSSNSAQPLSIFDFHGYYIEILIGAEAEKYISEIAKKAFTATAKSNPTSYTDIPNLQGILNLLKYDNSVYKGSVIGKYINLSGVVVGDTYTISYSSASAYSCGIFDIEQGDMFLLYPTGTTSSAKAYAILDSANKVLEIQQNVNNKFVVAPANAKKLIVNGYKDVAFLTRYFYKTQENSPVDSPNKYENVLSTQGILNLLGNSYGKYFQTIKNKFVDLGSSTVGGTCDITDIESASGYTYEIIDVAPGDVFYGKCSDNTASAKAYAILNNSATNNVIDVQSEWNGSVIVMPANASKFVVNTKVSESAYLNKVIGNLTTLSEVNALLAAESSSIQNNIKGLSIALPSGIKQYIKLYNVNIGDTLSSFTTAGAVGYTYYVTKVRKGERYKIKTTGNTEGAKSYAVLDAANKVLDIHQNGGTFSLNITEDGWLIVNTLESDYEVVLLNWYDTRVKQGLYDVIRSAIYDIARFNNTFRFDYVEADMLYAGGLRLGYEKSLPRVGSIINTDVDLIYGLTVNTEMENVRKRIVPYLYWNQVKVGTILLYDTDGSPYFYNKDGEKVKLAVVNN